MTRAATRPALVVLLRAALLAGVTAACGGGAMQQMPVPAMSTAPVSLPPIQPATIAVPVTVSLTTLRATIEKEFPPADSLDQARCMALGGIVCHQYVYRRDSLDLRMDGDRLALFTRLRYRGRVALPRLGSLGSCGYDGETMKRAELRFATQLYWRNDWRLASRATAIGAQLQDACHVTMLNVDATPLMQRLVDAQLRKLAQKADSAIPALADLRPSADSLWRSMQEPVALDSANTVWLVMNPETARLAPLTGSGSDVSTTVVITARPRVVLGARPSTTTAPLPALQLAPPATGLHVPVQVEMPFAELSQYATTTLAAQTKGQRTEVRDVKVWGVGDTAVVKLTVGGSVDGALYLLGRFAYDTATRAVLLQDLRYTLASDHAMSRMKATLGATLVRRAIEEATGHGRLDVGAQLDSARDALTAQLNRPLATGTTVSGTITSVRVTGVYTLPTAFVVRVMLDGEARLRIE